MFAATQTTAPAPVLALTAPAAWLCLDLETGDAPEEAITAAIEAWKPGNGAKTADEINAEAERAAATWTPPSNIKDPVKIEERREAALAKIEADRIGALAKIEERRAEAAARIQEKSALLDAAPVVCIGVQTDQEAVEFNGMDMTAFDIGGMPAVPCGDERNMLIWLRDWLDLRTGPGTVIVGQNIRNWDLPKLRNAYLRHRLRLPAIFAPRILDSDPMPAIVDTASLFKAFSAEHRDNFCPSLDVICAGLGIPKPKSVISGADVPRLYREGRYHEILIYNAVDREATTRAYLLMTGQADDLM
jgi:hypothetical protein